MSFNREVNSDWIELLAVWLPDEVSPICATIAENGQPPPDFSSSFF